MELNIKDAELCAIQATNRQALVDYINAHINSGFFKGQSDAPYLRVELLGCEGGSVDYKTEADVPEHCMPCSCGNPKHWLIKYVGNA